MFYYINFHSILNICCISFLHCSCLSLLHQQPLLQLSAISVSVTFSASAISAAAVCFCCSCLSLLQLSVSAVTVCFHCSCLSSLQLLLLQTDDSFNIRLNERDWLAVLQTILFKERDNVRSWTGKFYTHILIFI